MATAAKKSTQRAKFSYVNREDITKLINNGNIDANDIIYTKDTHENIFIGSDLSINPIRSKIYRFSDVSSAEKSLNTATDTYEGQIVAILTDGAYTAYIVNKNTGGTYYVTKLSEDAKTLNYDNLGNRPIDNLDGTLDDPITISDLATGIYKIRGQYKICSDDITTYLSSNDNFFLVDHDGTEVAIRKITAHNIIDYTVSENSIVSQTNIPTREWIESQGYVTEASVNEKIAALDFMTKEEVAEYVQNEVLANLEPLIDKRIDLKLNESFSQVEASDISYLF
jgi:hypothetical protein